MIDVRSPGEFASGALPFAINLPLLDDSERREVGICYKQKGQQAAIDMGHTLVNGAVREARIEAWRAFIRAHPDAAVYCARGGLRSELSQRWLADAGVVIPRVEGGFKSLRNFLLEYVKETCRVQKFVLLSGMTGTGKTELIKTLDSSIDLERIANHKGSSFGQPLDDQPAQIDFENTVTLELMRLRERDTQRCIVLEDEGRNIGGRHLPAPLVDAMGRSPIVIIELPFKERIDRLWQEYVVDRYAQTVDLYGEEAEAAFASYLRDSVNRIKKRLGGQRTQEILSLMEDAIKRQHRDDFASHRLWLEVITAEYYDPMYRYQLQNRKERVAFRGNRQRVISGLADMLQQPTEIHTG